MHNNTHNSKMMWWMMAGCLVLPIAILFLSGKSLGSSGWLLFGFLIVCVGGHALMMRGMHNKDESNTKSEDSDHKH